MAQQNNNDPQAQDPVQYLRGMIVDAVQVRTPSLHNIKGPAPPQPSSLKELKRTFFTFIDSIIPKLEEGLKKSTLDFFCLALGVDLVLI